MERTTGASDQGSNERFAWHPRYQGRTAWEVAEELRVDLERDQRAHALAMEGAEEHEQAVLASVIDLEKKWGEFDMDWAEADAAELAERIAAFEQERDRRRELFSFGDYRRGHADTQPSSGGDSRPWWAFWRR